MEKPLWEVPSWEHEDLWEDWRNARSDEERRMILRSVGVPPELRSEAERLFPSPKTGASRADASEPGTAEDHDHIDKDRGAKFNRRIGLLTLIVAIVALLWDHWPDIASLLSRLFPA